MEPKNHEKLQAVSLIVLEELARREEEGVPYSEDVAERLTRQAIKACMPGLADLTNKRIMLEAHQGISVEGEEEVKLSDGLAVSAMFRYISIRELVGWYEGATISEIDLLAVMTPTYINPEPAKLEHGGKLYVPLGALECFEKG